MLNNIFAEDELPNFEIYETAHTVIKDYMDRKCIKIDAVAAELETTRTVLYRQLNPKDTQMPLSIDRIISITKLTDDTRIVESINKKFDLIAIKPPNIENKEIDFDLLLDSFMIKHSDVFRAFKMALADGVITDEEKKQILKELHKSSKSEAALKKALENTGDKS